jgi:hypothetical protein
MVEAAAIRMRLQEYKDIAGGLLLSIPNAIRAMEPKLLRIHVVGTPADAAGFTEIDPNPAYLNESTAVAIEILSSSADDNGSATGAVQSVTTIGIDGNDEIVARSQPLHATVGTTVVTSTDLYKDVFHHYANSWGSSDKDAAGNITIRNIADTALCVLTAGKNESEGSAFKVPDNHVAMLAYGLLRRLTAAAGVYAADEGIRLRIVYIDPIDGATGLAAADRCNNWIDVESVGGYTDQAQGSFPIGQCFESGTWLHFYHSSKVDAGEEYDLVLEFLIWKK